MTYHVQNNQTRTVEVEPGLFGVPLIDGGTGARNVSMLRGWIKPGAAHSPHTHEAEEVVAFLSGTGTIKIGNDSYKVGPGDALLIPANVVHSTENHGSEDLLFIAAFSDSIISASNVMGEPGDVDAKVCSSRLNRFRWRLRRLLNRLLA